MSWSDKDWPIMTIFFGGGDECLKEGVPLNNLQESAIWPSNSLDYICPLSLLTNPWRHLHYSLLNFGDDNSLFFLNVL